MIYIDRLMTRSPRRRKWRASCHMYSFDLKALHRFAEQLGLKRTSSWDPDKRLPHYDLTAITRAAAVKAGAVEVDRQTLASHMRCVA